LLQAQLPCGCLMLDKTSTIKVDKTYCTIMEMSLINIIIILLLGFQITIVHANPVPSKINSKTFKPYETATVAKGSTVALQCYFNSNVNCAWVRRGILLTIGQRYKYQEGNGEDTKDCSLLIENIAEIDDGEWKCESLGDDSKISVTGSLVQVAIQNSIDISTRPTESSYRTSLAAENDAMQKDSTIIILIAITIIFAVVALVASILFFYSRRNKNPVNEVQPSAGTNLLPQNDTEYDTSSNVKLITGHP